MNANYGIEAVCYIQQTFFELSDCFLVRAHLTNAFTFYISLALCVNVDIFYQQSSINYVFYSTVVFQWIAIASCSLIVRYRFESNRTDICANRPAPNADAMLVLKQYRGYVPLLHVSEVIVPGYRCFLACSRILVACLYCTYYNCVYNSHCYAACAYIEV